MALNKEQRKFLSQFLKVGTQDEKDAKTVAYEAALQRKAAVELALKKIKASESVKGSAPALEQKLNTAASLIQTGKFKEANIALTTLEGECKAVLEKADAIAEIRRAAGAIKLALVELKKSKSVAEETGEIEKSLVALLQRAKDGDVQGAAKGLTELEARCGTVKQFSLNHLADQVECDKQLKLAVATVKSLQQLPNVRPDDLKEILSRFQAARTLRDGERFSFALAAVQDIADLAEKAKIKASLGPITPGENPVKLNGKAAAEKLRQEKIDAHTLEAALVEETIDAALNDDEISELLATHRASLKREAAVFRGYRWLDDVIEIKDESLRSSKLAEIAEAVTDAKERQRRLVALLKKVPKSPTTTPAINDAWKLVLGMTNHIPEAFLAETDLESRLDVLTMDPDEKVAAIQEATESLDAMVDDKGEPDPNGKITRAQFEANLFKEMLEHGSLKGADRTQFFFDDPIRSLTPEQSMRLNKQYEIIISRAYKMRDAGASPDEVEASLKSVPPEFWPPAFIESLVAWRRVERELADERAQEIFTKQKLNPLDTAMDCVNFLADSFSLLGDISDTQKGLGQGEWLKNPDVVSYIKKYVDDVRSGWGLGQEYAEAMESCEFDQLDPKKLAMIPEKVASGVKTLCSSVASVKDLPGVPEASVFAAQVVPVLNCIASGIEMGLALKALAVSIQRRVQTGLMIDKAQLEYLSGRQRDGGAFVSALKNERGARKRQIAKKSVEATTKTMAFAGDVSSSTGADFGAGQVVKITGKAIEYGNKIVFAGIDWGIANQVKKLMKRAQAGDPIARMELMENSGLYAKMYICILAKDGHRLATTFIVQRGYTERELANPAISLKILREAMLKDADQRDETDVADNLGEALVEGVTGKNITTMVKSAGSFVADKVAKLGKKIKDLPKDKNIPYNAQWTAPVFDAATVTPALWNTAKTNAVKQAGLYDESSGIEKALKKLEPFVKGADQAIAAFDPTQAGPEEQKALVATVQKARNQVAEALATIESYTPVNNQGEFHEPMGKCLLNLQSALRTKRNQLDAALVTKKVKDPNWQPSAVVFRSPSWTLNWGSAVESLRMEIDDAGVGVAIKGYEITLASENLKTTAPKLKQRETRVALRENLKTAALSLKSLWSSAGEYPTVLTWLDTNVGLCLGLSQDNDKQLNGGEWKGAPADGDPALEVGAWTTIYESATAEGYAKPGDKKMSAALTKWTTEKGKFDTSKTPPAKMKQREECVKALAGIAGAAEALAKANPDTHSKFAAYLAALRRCSRSKVGELDSEQAKVTFTPVAGFTSAGWNGTLDAAVNAGAVANNKGARKLLGGALKTYEDKLAAMKKETGAKKKRKLAEEASKALAQVELAIGKVETAEGLDASEPLAAYFGELRKSVGEQTELQAVLDAEGVPATSFGAQTFAWANKASWQKVKTAAMDAGVLPEMGKTGFGERIDRAESAFGKWKAAPTDAKLKTAAAGALNGVTAGATSLKTKTKNKNMVAYLDDAAKAVRARLNEIQDFK